MLGRMALGDISNSLVPIGYLVIRDKQRGCWIDSVSSTISKATFEATSLTNMLVAPQITPVGVQLFKQGIVIGAAALVINEQMT